jgi:hypothetical protein
MEVGRFDQAVSLVKSKPLTVVTEPTTDYRLPATNYWERTADNC